MENRLSMPANPLLSEAEWRAVSGLRAVAKVALDQDILALQDRVRANIKTVDALLDRYFKMRKPVRAQEDGRIAPLAEWMRIQAFKRDAIGSVVDGKPGWLLYRDAAKAALAVVDRAAA